MKRNLHQNSQLYALLNQLNLIGQKELLVNQFTQGRTFHSSEMDMNECQALINHLNHLSFRSQSNPSKTVPLGKLADRMRKKILSICHELRWEHADGSINWDKVNGYLLKYGYLHKGLNEYTYAELPKLVTQFENLLRTTLYKNEAKA